MTLPGDRLHSKTELLEHTAHRPWPLPRGPWAIFMRWKNLAFLHWPIPPELLRPMIPRPLELDIFDGRAWIAVVPFEMEDVRLRVAPKIPTATNFPELNLRTYVRYGDRAGVWFFSFEAASRLAVHAARIVLNLAYYSAAMKVHAAAEQISYRSERIHRDSERASFQATYRPSGPGRHLQPGTLEHWLIERYCLFGQFPHGTIYFIDVHHPPWPVQDAIVEIADNTIASAAGIILPDRPPVAHFAKSLEVVGWLPKRLGKESRRAKGGKSKRGVRGRKVERRGSKVERSTESLRP
jgi:uncharacterized protein YqjF (DUF2071 family)